MKVIKKFLAVVISAILVALCFAGCSKSGPADEITAKTMLIAYTEDNAPFVYEENGEVKGFDVELFEKIFVNVKNEYKNYKFVKVDKDYKIGEDVYCVDKDGENCIAYVMIGGVQKDTGSVNENYTFSEDVINDRIITITTDKSGISNYASLEGKTVGVVTGAAKAALDKHTAIRNGCKAVQEYKAEDIAAALADLDAGKINALVVDEFVYHTAEKASAYKILDGELDNISYAYFFKKWDWYNDAINEAIYELKSPDYNDADEFTPIVEKYFGYNASSFEYTPPEEK